MRTEYRVLRVRARIASLSLLVSIAFAVMIPARAEAGLFDFLFGRSTPQAAPVAPPVDLPSDALPPPPGPGSHGDSGIRGMAFCVRLCDGRYFPVQGRGGVSAAQMCQSFCPASATKTLAGSNIARAFASDGTRYADLPNAYLFREKYLADCTCNGRDGMGLAAVDISFDATLRPGDIVATTTGLVAFSGSHSGRSQTSEFTPVAAYPGLTPETRAKLGAMKVMPATGEIAEERALPAAEVTGSIGEFLDSRAQARQ